MKIIRDKTYYHLQRSPIWAVGDVKFVGLQTNNYFAYFDNNAHNFEDPVTHQIIPVLDLVLYLENYFKTGIKIDPIFSYDVLASIKCIRNVLFNYSRFLREYLFEEVRVKSFPDYPSRQKGLSVISSKEDIPYWIKTLGINIDNGVLLELSLTGKIHEASHSSINLNTNSFNGIRRQGFNYWLTEEVEEDPFIGNECIFEGTAIVQKSIAIKEYLYMNNSVDFDNDENIKYLSKIVDIKHLKKIILDGWKLGNIHGFPHWQRVARNGKLLATSDVNLTVVYLFAFLHDTFRNDDGGDIKHGERSAKMLKTMRSSILKKLSNEEFEMLEMACFLHSTDKCTDNSTINVCLDANRLDLARKGVGIYPDPTKMATVKGKYFATNYDKFIKLSGNNFKK